MKIIALTGGIACGKTTLANMLRELGAPVIDADAISRSLTAPGGKALPALREAFEFHPFFSSFPEVRKSTSREPRRGHTFRE